MLQIRNKKELSAEIRKAIDLNYIDTSLIYRHERYVFWKRSYKQSAFMV